MSMDAYPSDWKKRRSTVFNRDDKTCTECGYSFEHNDPKAFHVHHVKPISEGGGHGLENLVTLCEDCHVNAHTKGPPHPSRIPFYDCSRCGQEYPGGYGVGSFCSFNCLSKFRAKKLLKHIHNDVRICSSCFSKIQRSNEVCPNCDNWDYCEVNRERLTGDQIDITELLAYAYRSWREPE